MPVPGFTPSDMGILPSSSLCWCLLHRGQLTVNWRRVI